MNPTEAFGAVPTEMCWFGFFGVFYADLIDVVVFS